MYKVETHNNSKDYFRSLVIEKDAVYITANNSIAKMMREVSRVNLSDKWRIIDIENFTETLYPRWSDKIVRIKLKGMLRLILLERKLVLKDEEILKEINYFEDNIEILFSDFLFLFEAGIKSLKVEEGNIKYELINDIYVRFINDDLFKENSRELGDFTAYEHIKERLLNKYTNSIKRMDEAKGEEIFNKNKQENVELKRIYFYNLNNIDLRRYLIIEELRVAGYEVIFRIPYFNNLSVTNKCWDMIYGDSSIFKIKRDSQYSDSFRKDIKYLGFLEGKEIENTIKENVTVKGYREVHDFKNDVKDNVLVTFYKDSLVSVMDRSRVNLKSHCYQSAMGRFIFNLYKCKVVDNTVKMDFNTYRELITSGWIEYREWNGNRLSAFLLDNEEYFSGVRSIDEIIERINKLKDAEEAGLVFEEQAKLRIKKDKTKAFLSNPFRAFGYLNLEKYKITANYMLEVTLKLKRFIMKEFEGEYEVLNVTEHLKNMKLLFRTSSYLINLYKEGNQDEKNILKRIYALLSRPDLFPEILHKDELADLLYNYLYLSNKNINNKENYFSIDQLEGVILRDKLFKESNKICLCDLSYKSYEYHIEKYRILGKILTDEDMVRIFKDNLCGRNRETVLKGMDFKEKSKMSGEAYIKFALANLFINFDGSMEFSFIEGLRKDDSKSVILKQIESIYDNTVRIEQKLDLGDIFEEEHLNNDIHIYDKKLVKENKKKLPEAAFRDLDFCGEKFLYSSIIGDYPIYYSDYHNRLAFSVLLSIWKNSMEDAYKNICKFIFPLFPQWEDVVKKNILDCEYARKNINVYKYYDGINYPKTIDSLYLLKSRYLPDEKSRIRNRYNKEEFDGESYYSDFINEYLEGEDVNSGKHCMMCPHCYVCKKGEFLIDNK